MATSSSLRGFFVPFIQKIDLVFLSKSLRISQFSGSLESTFSNVEDIIPGFRREEEIELRENN